MPIWIERTVFVVFQMDKVDHRDVGVLVYIDMVVVDRVSNLIDEIVVIS